MDDDVVELPIDGVLDLHTFAPSEVKDLVGEYIGACVERGIGEVRIVHGKGTGTLKRIVEGVLERDERVISYRTAGEAEGGWGATVALLQCSKG